jgi:hypothetical protein
LLSILTVRVNIALAMFFCGMSTKITPSASQKAVAMTFAPEGVDLKCFHREAG